MSPRLRWNNPNRAHSQVGTIPARHAAESTTLLRKSVQSGSGQGGPWNTRCRRLSDFWITSDPTSWLISRLRFRVAGATGSLFLELHRQVNERPSRDFNSWGFNSLGKLNESAMGVKQLELRWPLGFPALEASKMLVADWRSVRKTDRPFRLP